MKTLSIKITLCSLVIFLGLNISLAQTSEEIFEVPPTPSGYTSTYTPLTDAGCHYLELSVWDEDAPIDYFTLECPAYAGYQVLIAGGDLRSHLEIIQHGEDNSPSPHLL